MHFEFCSNWLRLITLCKNITFFWSCGPDCIELALEADHLLIDVNAFTCSKEETSYADIFC